LRRNLIAVTTRRARRLDSPYLSGPSRTTRPSSGPVRMATPSP
jgi:hypothetical protein